ncbi:phospholipase patatin family [Ruminococcus sp. CAG:353]|nr:phospholipase patatin family [Ruminococcus sp. CAG:353]
MTGLVLEGGTFRGTFSAGFMDALIEENIEFPYIVGVSAGISNAASYVSKQFGRNLEIFKKYRNDKRYVGAGNYMRCKSYFGLDFVYDEIPNKLVPFDYEEYHKYKGRFLVGVTNAETGKFECFDGIKDTDKWQYLRASCAIPGYFPPIMINGKPYFDGGLASPICVKQALKDGCTKTVIILTQPKGFVKKCGKGNIVMSQLIKSKYPAMEMPLLARHKLYNNQIQFCEELERRGKALIFRPSEALDSFQKSSSELERYWKMGYDLAKANADRIRDFMN